MGSTEEKESKNYVITVNMIHSVMSNHIVKHDFKFISDDIESIFELIAETVNESKFLRINNSILKCDNIDNIVYKEVE